MSDGHPPFDAYNTRSNTFSPGSQVASAVLNAMQDGAIAVSEALDTLAGRMPVSITGSGNLSDSPAPDQYGGWTVWCEARTNGVTPIVLDNSRDYRDRFIVVLGAVGTATTYRPGGADDDAIEAQLSAPADGAFDSGAISTFGYTQQGSADGTTGVVKTIYVITSATYIYLYARSTDGALMMVRNTASNDRTVMISVTVSPNQNHY